MKLIRYVVAEILWFFVDLAITTADNITGTRTRPLVRPKWADMDPGAEDTPRAVQ